MIKVTYNNIWSKYNSDIKIALIVQKGMGLQILTLQVTIRLQILKHLNQN